MPRPAIGLCLSQARARYGAWDMDAVLLPRNYVDAIQAAGGLAVALVPDPVTTADPDEVLDRLDGLILAGGVDVGVDPERDAFEMALGRRAMERDLPLLAICRGMQVVNVDGGGTLVAHVPDLVGHEAHNHEPGQWSDHAVRLQAGSAAARAAGETEHLIRSHHHQAVDAVAPGWTVTGHAADDGLPEAMEADGHRFALAVQWHPEADERSRVIAALVEEAGRG